MECRRPMQIFLYAVLVLAFVGQCFAVPVDNLYTVVIQVPDNTLATRNKHLPQAFEHVIKRVASSQNVINDPQYEAARQHLDRFVSHYFYTNNPDETFTLTLRFNEQTINGFLYKVGRQTLGKNRQQVLMWLVMEQANGSHFVTHGPHGEIADKISSLSTEYGVPIIIPLLDLTERIFVTEADVINHNMQPLQQAAERYNVKTMLLGKINNSEGHWSCEWHLVNNEQDIVWHTNGNSLDVELEQMVNQLADQMIAYNTQVHLPKIANHGVTLRVKGVQSVADYSKILDHLRRLSIVQNVEIGSVDGTHAVFLVTADGGLEALTKALKLSTLLITDLDNPQAIKTPGASLDLTYRISS